MRAEARVDSLAVGTDAHQERAALPVEAREENSAAGLYPDAVRIPGRVMGDEPVPAPSERRVGLAGRVNPHQDEVGARLRRSRVAEHHGLAAGLQREVSNPDGVSATRYPREANDRSSDPFGFSCATAPKPCIGPSAAPAVPTSTIFPSGRTANAPTESSPPVSTAATPWVPNDVS